MNIEVYEVDLIIIDDDDSSLTTYSDRIESANEGKGLIEFRDKGRRTSIVVDLRKKENAK